MKKCECGGELKQCEVFAGMGTLSIRVPNGYNFPKDYRAIPFLCEKCGKITFYADIQPKNK